ncbi:uncharacterized protein TNCV_3497031 [Trichonephila clavipes]|nr:uncharacterized protein TNCV_3497031 [Trichonephila clavipes]
MKRSVSSPELDEGKVVMVGEHGGWQSPSRMIKRVEDILEDIYYDVQNPASYGGKLAKEANVPVKVAEKWLMTQDTYTTSQTSTIQVSTSKTLSYGIGDLIQSDLVDMSKFSRQK